MRDAIESIAPTPVVEVRISNIFARGGKDAESVTAPAALCVIAGAGAPLSYELVVRVLADRVAKAGSA